MTQKETPLARQYSQIKAKHPDTILLFRMGDFYETFGNDAVLASKACGITLTKRNNGAEEDTPLAGFPHHQLDNYLPKLVRAGHRVAVCEQLEDPKQAKGIVKRGVVEVVTPGVVLYDKLLDHTANNYLCCLVPSTENDKRQPTPEPQEWGVALVDASTGTFLSGNVPSHTLKSVLESFMPAEVLVDKSQKHLWERLLQQSLPSVAITRLETWLFDAEFTASTSARHFGTNSLKGFGVEDQSLAATAVGVVLQYISETQKNVLPQLSTLRLLNAGEIMVLDLATRRNLEIHQPMHGAERGGALVGIIDRTVCAMGARLLRNWLQAPLVQAKAIEDRLLGVQSFVEKQELLRAVRETLSKVTDLERLITKVVTDRANARDLAAIRTGLDQLPTLLELIRDRPNLSKWTLQVSDHSAVAQMIHAALANDPPNQIGTGKMFRTGYNEELDETCRALTSGQDFIKEYQDRERTSTGISTLKIGYNNVFGYFIEVSKTQSTAVPAAYERKQTLANAERYTTPELKQLEHRLLSASARVAELEGSLLASLKREIGVHCQGIQHTARHVAMIDCLQSFAHVATEYEYVMPEVHTADELEIVGARHPVIERLLPVGVSYVPNSVHLDVQTQQIKVITGPNMSGKSSYLRQTGLIVFLAHIGSFVPATSARIPLTDRIFTRVGAQDNIVAGESTFLVEMQESANIIHNATSRSLILLDEVGRGTATFDGISIAWAIAEYLHEVVRAKTLFATHYHELTALAESFPRISNLKVEVVESDEGLVFTHRVVAGSADHSFGIHVARMAGMPSAILRTAEVVLDQLEHGTHDPARAARTSAVNRKLMEESGQMQMFVVRDDEFRNKIRSMDLDSLTPLQALQALAELKNTLN